MPNLGSSLRHPAYGLAGFAILLILTSCGTDVDQKSADTYSYQIHQQAVIRLDTLRRPVGGDSSQTMMTFSVEPGDSLVFVYKHNHRGPENVADAGYTETLAFQISPQAREFEYRGKQLNKIKAFYREACFCAFAGVAFPVSGGLLRGEKLSSVHWIVRGDDVTADSLPGDRAIGFEQPFYVK